MKKEPCDLIKKFSPELIKMIDDTKSDGNERSVNFCPSNGDIKLSDICIGDKCSIPSLVHTLIECKNKTAIGHLHTHPGIGVRLGNMSDNDVLYAIGKGEKFSCIGYRGRAKTIECYTYPYGLSKKDADRFKNMNIFPKEYKLLNDIQKYGINLEGTYIRKAETSPEQWKKLQEEANFLTDTRNQFKRYVNTTEAKEKRSRNSCAIFLGPLED